MSGRDAAGRVKWLGKAVQDQFAANRSVLSFSEYVALVEAAPQRHLRGSAQYLRDAFDYYGSEDVRCPTGSVRRFKLFDAPWDDGVGKLIGQEPVQNMIYRAVDNFVRQGRVDRFILMHGPNGSSKSTISELLARGLEHYSTVDEGALYRFNWIFPTQAVEHSGIGFGGSELRAGNDGGSYAHLDDSAIDARLPCELRDHPMLLIPKGQRREMLEQMFGDHPACEAPILSAYLLDGALCHKCNQIYEALLSAYEGDFVRLARHIQIERFYVSRRYRVGTACVEPQLAVDAHSRQVTADRSLSALPSALQSVAMHEMDGELVRANRGLIDFADLFKRPLEAFKYLLAAVESGRVALAQANLFLDVIFVGSANETHLNAFMETPEWMSFKARVELVRVPYLRDFRLERQICDAQLSTHQAGKPTTPHVTEAAALWAVLTRMRRPNASLYPEELHPLLADLSPLDKAMLYAEGRVPADVSDEMAKLLRANIEALYRETDAVVGYEGRTGASAREVKTVLMNAAQDARHRCLAPESLLGELERLVQETSVYQFLRQEVQGSGYYDHAGFIDMVRQWWLDLADDEVRGAMGLIEEASYAELFARYITHVTHHVRREKLHNPVTGAFEDPDVRLMDEVEKTLLVEQDAAEFRQSAMSRIGAWSVDHPGEKPVYSEIFAEQFSRMREQYFTQQRTRVGKLIQRAVHVLSGEDHSLAPEEQEEVQTMLERLRQQYGYSEPCAQETLIMLARHRYAD